MIYFGHFLIKQTIVSCIPFANNCRRRIVKWFTVWGKIMIIKVTQTER